MFRKLSGLLFLLTLSFAFSNFFSFLSYRNCYTPLSLIMCSYLLRFDPFDERSPYQMFQCTLLAFMPLHLTLCFAALVIDIVGKWYYAWGFVFLLCAVTKKCIK